MKAEGPQHFAAFCMQVFCALCNVLRGISQQVHIYMPPLTFEAVP